MPLQWSEDRAPCDDCRYNHAVAETPLGKLYIEWKGWKDYPSPTCGLPWGTVICGSDVADAKRQVQAAWDVMAAKVAALSLTPVQRGKP